MDYADRIFFLRKSQALTRKELASGAGLSEESVKSYERRAREPAYRQLLALAKYFNVSLDYLVGRSNTPNFVA